MGRRKPQRQVLIEEADAKIDGAELPFYGFPADSGFEINFAKRLYVDWGASEDENSPEWETLYSRRIGRRTVFHQRSRITKRARLTSCLNTSDTKESSEDKTMLVFRTMKSATHAHTVTAEKKAMRKLRKHLDATQWRSYTLTGMFTELSKRSGVYYIFRKVAPTIACRIVGSKNGVLIKPFLTLCMHPVGYTAFSGTGCMCPTDDVISHLLLMRSDEHLYWKKATHHQVDETVSML